MNSFLEKEYAMERMENLRERLTEEVAESREYFTKAISWKHLVSKYPLQSAALAAAVGYFLVPKKTKQYILSKEDVEKFVASGRLSLHEGGNSAADRPSLLGMLGSLAATSISRIAVNALIQRLSPTPQENAR